MTSLTAQYITQQCGTEDAEIKVPSVENPGLKVFPMKPVVIVITYPLTARVVGAPQMISQPVSSTFPCFSLPSVTWRTPGLSIPWCCLPTSSSVCLIFFPLSLCLARWFWPDLMNGRNNHTTAVCVSLRSSGDFHVVQLPAGSWHGFLFGNMVFV